MSPPKPKTLRLEKGAMLLATAAPKNLMIHRDELPGREAGMTARNQAGWAFRVEVYGGRHPRFVGCNK